MVALAERSKQRLTLQVQDIAANTTTIRSLDWDRDRSPYNAIVMAQHSIAT